jgi:hypothetical protein
VPGLDGRKPQNRINVKYWEVIAERLNASGASWGRSSQIDAMTGRVLYTADAYRKDRKRFTVVADDRLTAFLELEKAALPLKCQTRQNRIA